MNETTTEDETMFFDWIDGLKPHHVWRILLSMCLFFWAVAAALVWTVWA